MSDKEEAKAHLLANFRPEKDTIRFRYLGSAIWFVNRLLYLMGSTK